MKKKLYDWPDISIVEHWLKRYSKDEWMMFETTLFLFVSEEEAMAFKLRWL